MLTTREVKRLLDQLDGTMWLVAALLYGTVETTMVYTDVLNIGGRGVRSPLDAF